MKRDRAAYLGAGSGTALATHSYDPERKIGPERHHTVLALG